MPSPRPLTPLIEHVVVLMMENHSFDNMLGWWSGELTGNESNESADGVAYTTGEERNPPFMTDPCPGHAFPNVNLQVFGTKHPSRGTSPRRSQRLVTMGGFVKDYVQNAGGAGREGNVMGCYSPKQLPVMTALANNFTVCSRWFASVPGPTAPNRIYANCASSRG